MDEQNLKQVRLESVETETFEISLHLLTGGIKEMRMTKKQAKILRAATKRKSKTFHELKYLSRISKSGKYTPYIILRAIRKNQSVLTATVNEDQNFSAQGNDITSLSKKRHKEKLINDIKLIEDTFSHSLNCLIREKKNLKLPNNTGKIIIAAKKGKDKKSELLFRKLKSLTKVNKLGLFKPFDILKAIDKNRLELLEFLEGKMFLENQNNFIKKQRTESLPLDRNYKYPIKTSTSIWTVKKK